MTDDPPLGKCPKCGSYEIAVTDQFCRSCQGLARLKAEEDRKVEHIEKELDDSFYIDATWGDLGSVFLRRPQKR